MDAEIGVMCGNSTPGAGFGLDAMAPLEAEPGIPVIDSAAAGVWGCLSAIGADMASATPLGRIFALGV